MTSKSTVSASTTRNAASERTSAAKTAVQFKSLRCNPRECFWGATLPIGLLPVFSVCLRESGAFLGSYGQNYLHERFLLSEPLARIIDDSVRYHSLSENRQAVGTVRTAKGVCFAAL